MRYEDRLRKQARKTIGDETEENSEEAAMNTTTAVDIYDSQTSRYHHAFQVFLDPTDQKDTARDWLNRHVQKLPLS